MKILNSPHCFNQKKCLSIVFTQRKSVCSPIRGDIRSIRYEFEIQAVAPFTWITSTLNIENVSTKRDSLSDKSSLISFSDS